MERKAERGCENSHPLPSKISREVGLENELRADLTNTPGLSVRGLSELVAVSIADYASEVGMIEYIEHFESHVQRRRFGDFRVLLQAQIRVDRSRPVETELLRAAGHTAGFIATLPPQLIRFWANAEVEKYC